MTLPLTTGYNTVLKIDPANGTSFSAIVGIIDKLDGPSAKTRVANTSFLTQYWDTFKGCGGDPGDVTFRIAAAPSATDLHTLSTLLGNGNVAAFQIVFSDAGQEVFHGIVTAIDRKVDKNMMVEADLTIKISGDPGYSMT